MTIIGVVHFVTVVALKRINENALFGKKYDALINNKIYLGFVVLHTLKSCKGRQQLSLQPTA